MNRYIKIGFNIFIFLLFYCGFFAFKLSPIYGAACSFPSDNMPVGGVNTISSSCSVSTEADIITGVEDNNTSATDASNSASLIIDGSTLTVGANDNQTVLFGQIKLASTTFYDKVSYDNSGNGQYLQKILVGDINGDEEVDLIGLARIITVSIGNGDGTFTSPVEYTTTAHCREGTLHDINGDGKLDIVAHVRQTIVGPAPDYDVGYKYYIDTFINNGDGTFADVVTYSVTNEPDFLMVDDVNGDEKADIVIMDYEKPRIFINNGDGTFADYISTTDYVQNPTSMALHDINGDGSLDIIAGTKNYLNILINNGNATFASNVRYPLTTYSTSLGVNDINGDDYPDIVAATNGYFSVFINNGDGTFASEVAYLSVPTSSVQIDSMILSDVDGDGNLDALVVSKDASTDGNLGVFISNGDGTFADVVNYSLPYDGYAIKAADISGDEKPDVIIGTNQLFVLVNKGDGTFDSPVPYITSKESYTIEIYDVSGDDKLDILVTGISSRYTDVFIHKPKGSIVIAKDRGAQLLRGVRWVLDADNDGKTETATPSAIASAVRPSSSYIRKNYASFHGISENTAYYKMDEAATSSAYLDSSGTGNTGTVYGSVSVASGKYNNGLYFNGSSSSYLYLGEGYTQSTNNFTYAFWVNPEKNRSVTTEATSGVTGTTGQSYVFYPEQSGSNAGAGVSVGINGVSVFEHGDSYLPSLLVHTVTLSGWNHIVVVYENKRPRLYINGQLKRTGLTSTKTTVYSSTKIGGGLNTYGPFKGYLDEVKVFDRALTTQEIYALYDAGKIFVTDCNDNDSEKWQNFTGYTDSDGDNYGTGESQQVCSGATLLSGYGQYGGDCNDSDDTKWKNKYLDSDQDGYGMGDLTCVGDEAGYTADEGGDCYDSGTGAANAHPGQTTYYTSARGDGSFDYDCNGTQDKDPTYNCTRTYSTSCGSTQTPGYNASVPACGSSASFYGVDTYSSSINCTFKSGATSLETCGTPPTSNRRSYTVGTVQMGCR